MKFPKNIPNLNQILFNGKSNFELISPNERKIIDIIKDQERISFCFNKGQREIIKKTIANTMPKFLFDGSLIFCCIIYVIIFSLISKAFINSFHSRLDNPEEAISTFFPEIRSFITFFPFEDTSVPPTL